MFEEGRSPVIINSLLFTPKKVDNFDYKRVCFADSKGMHMYLHDYLPTPPNVQIFV